MNIVKKIISVIIENSNNGTTPISFESHTTPKMNKRGNPFFGKVKKISFVGGLIGTIYENSVNNQLDRENKESNFVVQPRKWGVRDENHRFLIRHTKKGESFERSYLSVKVQQTHRKPIYIDTENGEVISVETLRPFLPKSKKPNTQWNLDKEVMERDYEISNLKNISIGGKKFSFIESDKTETVTVFKVKGDKVNSSDVMTVESKEGVLV